MDENAFRATYKQINQQRCVFEKAINSRRCQCLQVKRIYLASREIIGCRSPQGLRCCTNLLENMRENARFVLHLPLVRGPLPHNKEIRVQVGGLKGLAKQLNLKIKEDDETNQNESLQSIDNIYGLIRQALAVFNTFEQFPYAKMVQSMAKFKGRRKRNRPKKE